MIKNINSNLPKIYQCNLVNKQIIEKIFDTVSVLSASYIWIQNQVHRIHGDWGMRLREEK